jgi:hypothetical protein
MQAAPAADVDRQPESTSPCASGFHTPSRRQKQWCVARLKSQIEHFSAALSHVAAHASVLLSTPT